MATRPAAIGPATAAQHLAHVETGIEILRLPARVFDA